MTLEEAKQLRRGDYVYHKRQWGGFDKADGSPQRWRITSIKTWKRDPYRIELHASYGLYKHTTIIDNELPDWFLSERAVEIARAKQYIKAVDDWLGVVYDVEMSERIMHVKAVFQMVLEAIRNRKTFRTQLQELISGMVDPRSKTEEDGYNPYVLAECIARLGAFLNANGGAIWVRDKLVNFR